MKTKVLLDKKLFQTKQEASLSSFFLTASGEKPMHKMESHSTRLSHSLLASIPASLLASVLASLPASLLANLPASVLANIQPSLLANLLAITRSINSST
jgi:hypothetical protein